MNLYKIYLSFNIKKVITALNIYEQHNQSLSKLHAPSKSNTLLSNAPLKRVDLSQSDST